MPGSRDPGDVGLPSHNGRPRVLTNCPKDVSDPSWAHLPAPGLGQAPVHTVTSPSSTIPSPTHSSRPARGAASSRKPTLTRPLPLSSWVKILSLPGWRPCCLLSAAKVNSPGQNRTSGRGAGVAPGQAGLFAPRVQATTPSPVRPATPGKGGTAHCCPRPLRPGWGPTWIP